MDNYQRVKRPVSVLGAQRYVAQKAMVFRHGRVRWNCSALSRSAKVLTLGLALLLVAPPTASAGESRKMGNVVRFLKKPHSLAKKVGGWLSRKTRPGTLRETAKNLAIPMVLVAVAGGILHSNHVKAKRTEQFQHSLEVALNSSPDTGLKVTANGPNSWSVSLGGKSTGNMLFEGLNKNGKPGSYSLTFDPKKWNAEPEKNMMFVTPEGTKAAMVKSLKSSGLRPEFMAHHGPAAAPWTFTVTE